MKKVLKIGRIKVNNRYMPISIEVNLQTKKEKLVLSITGQYWDNKKRDCYTGGQIYDTLLTDINEIEFKDNWNKDKLLKLIKIWKRWHLNNLNAGSPKQEAYLRPLYEAYDGHEWYDYAKTELKKAGLNPDMSYQHHNIKGTNGYLYGHSWIHEDLPQEIITYIENL